MKKINLLTAVFLFYSISLYTQPDTSVRNFPDRYKLDLPQEWNKTKLIEAIVEILPKTFGEYIDSNKQFCMDCKAGLTVMLVIDRPLIKPAEASYRFRAALGLFDSTGKELIELLLVSPQEMHQIKVNANYTKEPLPLTSNDVIQNVIKDRDGDIVNVVKIPLFPPPMINNIPEYRSMYPSLNDLINIAEQRLYDIRKVVVNLK